MGEPEERLRERTGLRVVRWKGIGQVTGFVTGAWDLNPPCYERYAVLLQNKNPFRPRFNVMIQNDSFFHEHWSVVGRAPSYLEEFYLFPQMVPEEEARARYDKLWEEPWGDAIRRFDALREKSIKSIDSPEVVRP